VFQNLQLARPLVVLDLETTGTDVQTDRIIEISALKVFPDKSHDHRTRRVDPGILIPPAATEVHGISDADVAGCPPFSRIASGVIEFMDGCDLAGFNLIAYDLRLLTAECQRAGVDFPLVGRKIVDSCKIFHARERRDLSAALRFYCGKEHTGAHGAAADVIATLEILDAQVVRYDDLPRDIDGLHELCIDTTTLDVGGMFTADSAGIVFAKGKYKGSLLATIAVTKPDYLRWMLKSDFFDDTKQIVREAINQTMADTL